MKNVLKFSSQCFFKYIKMLRRKKFLHGYNSNYKYTFKREFQQSNWWASSDTGKASGGREAMVLQPSDVWTLTSGTAAESTWRSHSSPWLAYKSREYFSYGQKAKQTLRETWLLTTKSLSSLCCCVLPLNRAGLEQLSDQIKDEAWTGLVGKGSCVWAGWRGPSHVCNTLVLLQGDGLSRYIRVQAVQLGGRSLRATTPSDRAWGTQRRTSFGPVLESACHSAGCDGIPFHRGLWYTQPSPSLIKYLVFQGVPVSVRSLSSVLCRSSKERLCSVALSISDSLRESVTFFHNRLDSKGSCFSRGLTLFFVTASLARSTYLVSPLL